MPTPSRVLLVVAHGGAGGMQVQIGLLAGGLQAAGCEVTIASGPGPIDAGDVPIERLPALTANGALPFARSLRRVVRDTGADVVHGHGLRLAPMLRVAARPRSLVTCHGIAPERVRATAALVRLSRVPIASCGEGPRRLLAAHGVASRVLPNAIAPLEAPIAREALVQRFGLDASTAIAISPARLTEQKDPVTVVRAVSHARGVSLLLVGGGPLEHVVRDEIAALGLDERVVLAGWIDDARSVLGAADILTLASTWEGQPTVVLEAMAAGVPVVATGCIGTVDTVVDGVTGLLAPVRDARALGAALGRVVTEPGLAERLADAARTQASMHTVDVVVAEHLAAYRRVLGGTWP